MTTIQNEFLEIKVKQTGAELGSIFNKKTNTEMLWQGNPEFWAGQAPVLFPIIGELKNGKYKHNNQYYELSRHGFARRSKDWEITKKNDSTIVCKLISNSETLKVYPFNFQLEVSYILNNNKLAIHHKITNKSDETMPFSIGGHPAFNCKLTDDISYSDYYLEFEKNENLLRYYLNENGLFNGKYRTVLHNANKLQLTNNLFDDDALVFKNLNSNKVSLNSPNGELLSVEFSGFPYLGIWAKPGAPFVCIEPWIGHADTIESDQNLFHKEGNIILENAENFEALYSIVIS